MSGYPHPSNKRQSVRCPVTGHRQDGELRVGKKRLKVLVLDESAGGFSVLCENTMDLQVGDSGLFRAGYDWYEIRITFLGEADSVPVDESDGKPRYRLGLYRVADTYNPDLKSSYVSWAGLTSQLKHIGPRASSLVVAGIVFAVVAVAGPFLTVMMVGSGADEQGPHTETAGENSLSYEPMLIPPRTEGRIAAAEQASTRETRPRSSPATTKTTTSASAESKAMKQIGMTLEELRVRIDQLPGAVPFTLPDVIEKLQLTETQCSQIRDLVEAAARLMKQLGLSANSDDPRVKEISEITRNQALEILDENQKKKWSELFGEKDKPNATKAQERRKP